MDTIQILYHEDDKRIEITHPDGACHSFAVKDGAWREFRERLNNQIHMMMWEEGMALSVDAPLTKQGPEGLQCEKPHWSDQIREAAFAIYSDKHGHSVGAAHTWDQLHDNLKMRFMKEAYDTFSEPEGPVHLQYENDFSCLTIEWAAKLGYELRTSFNFEDLWTWKREGDGALTWRVDTLRGAVNHIIEEIENAT